MFYENLASQILSGKELAFEECRQILACPDYAILALIHEAFTLRYHYFRNTVDIQWLNNAKSGLCAEDCHYCAQSQAARTSVSRYGLKDQALLLEEAQAALDNKQVKRYCLGLSGGRVTDQELEALCIAIRELKQHSSLPLCCSLGFITYEQALRLKAAGLERVNHNLNTSANYYPHICTTHTYAERVENIKTCQRAGLEICSGGIIGQGESDEDIINLFLDLRALNVNSIPVNFLVPLAGTPFAHQDTGLSPLRCLKILCLARFIHPERQLRVAAGREVHLKSLQPLLFFIADSVFANGYLTTAGQSQDETLSMLNDVGFLVAERDL